MTVETTLTLGEADFVLQDEFSFPKEEICSKSAIGKGETAPRQDTEDLSDQKSMTRASLAPLLHEIVFGESTKCWE